MNEPFTYPCWTAHVEGPDDVLEALDEAEAIRIAAEINGLGLENVQAHVHAPNVDWVCHLV